MKVYSTVEKYNQNELERGGLKYSICETKVVFMSFEIAGGTGETYVTRLPRQCLYTVQYLFAFIPTKLTGTYTTNLWMLTI